MTGTILKAIMLGLALLFGAEGAFAFGKGLAPSSQGEEWMWVGRPDGSTQCDPESGEALSVGAAQLKEWGVAVYAQGKGSDGKVRAQMCGMPTGNWNLYQISRQEWVRVQTAAASGGFRQAPQGTVLPGAP